MFQILLTPSAGKRLIAKAVLECASIKEAMSKRTVVIVAGTTNGYVAEELLARTGQLKEFNRKGFVRGITLPPVAKTTETGRLPDESGFPGDIVFSKGVWNKGKTIYDVIDKLKQGDVIIKGANCLDLVRKKAGVLIGHPEGGTIITILQAVVGKRVKLVLPIGLEKRIQGDIDDIADLLNSPGSSGLRMLPVSGEIVTEIEAIKVLFGLQARLVAGGGVCGAEGAVWLAINGESKMEGKARKSLNEIAREPPFSF